MSIKPHALAAADDPDQQSAVVQFAVVPSEREFVEITVDVLSPHAVEGVDDPAPEQAEIALREVGVDHAADVFLAMVDGPVPGEFLGLAVVGRQAVGRDNRGVLDVRSISATTIDLPAAPRPRLPGRRPPTYVSSASTIRPAPPSMPTRGSCVMAQCIRCIMNQAAR